MPALRRLLALLLTFMLASAAAAQPEDLFDFWLGDWALSWKNPDGTPGRGRNRITKTTDSRLIEEQFDDESASAPLRGRSLSVLEKTSGVWRQAWADNQGGFFAFSASTDGDKRIFATELKADGDKLKGQRMVFHSITRDAFVWDWEGTSDGGRSWKLLWHVEYRRR